MKIHPTMQKLLNLFESQADLARALNVESMTISQWKSRGYIPPTRARQIENVSGGKVTIDDVIAMHGDATIDKFLPGVRKSAQGAAQ